MVEKKLFVDFPASRAFLLLQLNLSLARIGALVRALGSVRAAEEIGVAVLEIRSKYKLLSAAESRPAPSSRAKPSSNGSTTKRTAARCRPASILKSSRGKIPRGQAAANGRQGRKAKRGAR